MSPPDVPKVDRIEHERSNAPECRLRPAGQNSRCLARDMTLISISWFGVGSHSVVRLQSFVDDLPVFGSIGFSTASHMHVGCDFAPPECVSACPCVRPHMPTQPNVEGHDDACRLLGCEFEGSGTRTLRCSRGVGWDCVFLALSRSRNPWTSHRCIPDHRHRHH